MLFRGFYRYLEHQFARLHERLDSIVASIADLDAAISAEKAELGSLASAVSSVNNDITNLIQKVQGGQAVDVAAELSAIQANTQALTNAVSTLTAADTSAQAAEAPAPAPAPAEPVPAADTTGTLSIDATNATAATVSGS